MIDKVEVRSPSGGLLTLSLTDVTSGFVIQDIQGLDPVKAVISSSSFAKIDGSRYQSSRRESRNLVLKIQLEPDYVTTSVRDLRNTLYNFFMPKTEVNLRFYVDDEDLVVNIAGRVEDFTSELFTKEPSVSISIICFEPDFVVNSSTTVSGSTVSTSTTFEINYNGTVDGGITFALSLNRSLSEFTIYHNPPDGTLRTLDFAESLVSGDVLTICTIPGSKAVTLRRSSVDTSLLQAMSPQSDWLQLQKGINTLRVYATGAAVPFTIVYAERHGGL